MVLRANRSDFESDAMGEITPIRYDCSFHRDISAIRATIPSANCVFHKGIITECFRLYLGPSKSITAPPWYQVTLLGGRSCSSIVQVKLIVLPFLMYNSWEGVILACISDRNSNNDEKRRRMKNRSKAHRLRSRDWLYYTRETIHARLYYCPRRILPWKMDSILFRKAQRIIVDMVIVDDSRERRDHCRIVGWSEREGGEGDKLKQLVPTGRAGPGRERKTPGEIFKRDLWVSRRRARLASLASRKETHPKPSVPRLYISSVLY